MCSLEKGILFLRAWAGCLLIAVLFVSPAASIYGQTYDLQFVFVQNNGVHFDVKIQARSAGTSFGMGDANLVFQFPSAAIGSPVLLSAHNFSGGFYSPLTVTQQAVDRASVNIVFDGFAGGGTSVTPAFVDVATVRFNVVSSATVLLEWRTEGSGHTVMFNDQFTLLTQGTLTGISFTPPPVINIHPVSQTVVASQSAVFFVTAVGEGPLAYQWQKNGTNIPAATSTTYTTPFTSSSDSGSVFRCVVSNTGGVTTSNGAVLRVNPNPSGIFSDDFSGTTIDQRWTFVNPRNDVTASLVGTGTTDARLRFVVPGGIAHDLWTGGATAPRLLQEVNNTNFEIELKLESVMTGAFQTNGVVIMQDSLNYVRFDFVRSNSTTRVFAASITNNVASTRSDIAITAGNPLYLRVRRINNQWTSFYSLNGTSWTQAASFSHTITVRRMGPFAGNAGNPVPAFTSLFDYFFNILIPIAPEDPTAPVPPSITTHPSGQNKVSGETATFSIEAAGTGPLAYQWQKNGANISGATSASYTTPVLVPADSGAVFRCRVANSAGSVFSNGAMLSVLAGPTVTSHPVSQTVTAGAGVAFSVTATGTPPLTYQWRKNGLSIAGATGPSYNIPAVAATDSGAVFVCAVSNLVGTSTSNAAILSVLVPAMITMHPESQKAAPGGTVTFTVSATGSAPLAFQWQRNGVDIPEANGSSYTTPPVVLADDGTAFRCRVQNSAGVDTSDVAVLSVSESGVPAPVIDVHPSGQTVVASQSALFSVNASGDGPLVYQWQKNSVNIDGATSSLYTVPATTAADSGAVFRCIVSNAGGSATSNGAALIVMPNPSGIFSDDFSETSLDPRWTFVNPRNDAAVSLTGTGTGDARLSIVVPGGISHDLWTNNPTAPRLLQEVNNADFEVELKFESVMTGAFQANGVIIMQDSLNFVRFDFVRSASSTRVFAASIANNVASTRSDITITAGNPLYLRVRRMNNQWTSFHSLNGNSWTQAASFAHTITVRRMGPFAGNAGNPTPAFTSLVDYFFNTLIPIVPEDPTSPVPPSITTHPANQTVSPGQSVTFSVHATGTAPLTYQWQKNGANIAGATSSSNTLSSVASTDSGAVYRCHVSNSAGSMFSNGAVLSVLSGPTITSHPASQSVVAGAGASFSVTATGTPPLSYQWQRNGTDIAGATGAEYTIPAVSASDSGAGFRCKVSNGVGTSTSAQAVLSVLTAAKITVHPTNQTTAPGTPATFSIAATGSGPLTFQWQKGGVDIAGANGSTYTTPPVVLADDGMIFRCRVQNSVGADTSNPATLSVSQNTDSTGIVSDNFNAAALNTSVWTFVNPLNDATLGMTGAAVQIGIPGGTAHDAWTGGNFAPRILQTANNTGFEVEAKFNSVMNAQYQSQGIIIQQDSANYIRCDFVRSATATRVFAASVVNNVATTRSSITIAAGNPLYIRVNRTGNTWRSWYSYNGSTWTAAANFTHTLTVRHVGPFLVNAGSPPPAFTGVVDYFLNTAFPLVPSISGGPRESEHVPADFILLQNYPNPFNPTTVIQFGLPVESHVRVTIYDILGRNIRTLVDQVETAGIRYAHWDGFTDEGHSVAAGQYLYRIDAVSLAEPDRTFRLVKKMLLLK